jgi:hypothetical protein
MLVIEIIPNLRIHHAGTRGVRLVSDAAGKIYERIAVVVVREEERE